MLVFAKNAFVMITAVSPGSEDVLVRAMRKEDAERVADEMTSWTGREYDVVPMGGSFAFGFQADGLDVSKGIGEMVYAVDYRDFLGEVRSELGGVRSEIYRKILSMAGGIRNEDAITEAELLDLNGGSGAS